MVLNAENTVLHFFGNYSDYLSLAPGRASLNFFHMLSEDLSLVSATAISRCRTEHTAVTYTDIAVDTPKGRRMPLKTVAEACEFGSAKIFKEHKVWVKTKEPVLIVRTNNKIPREEK